MLTCLDCFIQVSSGSSESRNEQTHQPERDCGRGPSLGGLSHTNHTKTGRKVGIFTLLWLLIWASMSPWPSQTALWEEKLVFISALPLFFSFFFFNNAPMPMCCCESQRNKPKTHRALWQHSLYFNIHTPLHNSRKFRLELWQDGQVSACTFNDKTVSVETSSRSSTGLPALNGTVVWLLPCEHPHAWITPGIPAL